MWGYKSALQIVRHYINKWHWILLQINNAYRVLNSMPSVGDKATNKTGMFPPSPYGTQSPEALHHHLWQDVLWILNTEVKLMNTEGLTASLQHWPLSGLSKGLIPTPSFLGLGFYWISTSVFSSFPTIVFLPTAILKPPEQQANLSNPIFSNVNGQWLLRAGGQWGWVRLQDREQLRSVGFP